MGRDPRCRRVAHAARAGLRRRDAARAQWCSDPGCRRLDRRGEPDGALRQWHGSGRADHRPRRSGPAAGVERDRRAAHSLQCLVPGLCRWRWRQPRDVDRRPAARRGARPDRRDGRRRTARDEADIRRGRRQKNQSEFRRAETTPEPVRAELAEAPSFFFPRQTKGERRGDLSALNTPPRSLPAHPGSFPCTWYACPRRSGASSRSPRRATRYACRRPAARDVRR